MEIAGTVLILAGTLIVAAAESTASGRLGINGMIGIRFGALMMSDRAWHLGHRAGRIPLDLAGVILVLTGVLVWMLPVPDDALGIVVVFGAIASLGMLTLGAVLASREANRVLREDDPDN
jgi:hypothetical protein